MHFVIEHEKDGPWQLQILLDKEEIDTTQFEPIKKIFFCENMQEVDMVVTEIKRARFQNEI
jgi:hypothetical protein